MIRILPIILLLSGCTVTQKFVNCDNAEKARAAIALAYQALDRACPLPTEEK